MNALKRNRDGKEWTKLPSAGRLGDPPEWPDEVDEPSPNELLMWRRIWQSPQALIWEQDQTNDVVAFYVRTFLEAMKPHAGAMARTFAKQLANELYLTPPSLAGGRYVIEGTKDADLLDAAMANPAPSTYKPTGRPVGRPKGSRSKFTIVQPDPETPDDDATDDDDKDIPF
jgi:hypothetical protein